MLSEVIVDLFERVKQNVHGVLEGLSESDLTYQPSPDANTIAWLVWHLTRIQDDHVADVAKTNQVWNNGWSEKFALPFSEQETGYGHTPKQVALVKTSAELLIGYFDETHAASVKFIKTLTDTDYKRVVDERWQPPVTLAVRLVSVIDDDIQHAGQAAYIKGTLLS